MKINILVEGKRFEELSLDRQERIREKITDIQKDIVKRRLVRMIKNGKTEREIRDYLGLEN
ncbi:MAG: hypothetical protein MJA82_11035 [Clostridia bacterium]|nr:hypothetical protein [Clostridia bacterium]